MRGLRGWVAAFLIALALTAAGCGGSAPVRPSPVAGASSRPAQLVLAFWRAAGAGRYRTAYRDLGPPLRRALPYRRFAARLAGARAVFARIPRVSRVQRHGRLWVVRVASARGDLARPDAVQALFAVRRYAGGWRLAVEPVRTAGARARSPGTRRARPRGGRRATRQA